MTSNGPTAQATFRMAWWQPLCGAFWLVAITTGAWGLLQYAHTPGSAGAPPTQYPTGSSVPLEAQLPTLMMFVHPHCPCSRASLGELERIVARCSGRFAAYVIFFKPTGESETWVDTDLWKAAKAIPGVRVLSDENGIEAGCFHAETSGHTVVYGQDGRLMFQGGITHSRGHSGDSTGQDEVIAALETGLPSGVHTPVFGCALADHQPQPAR